MMAMKKQVMNRTSCAWLMPLLAPLLVLGVGCPDDDVTVPPDAAVSEQTGPLLPDSEEACEDFDTEYEGDELCLRPPAKGTGIQLHVGPKNYDDPDEVAPFLIQPGEEVTECYFLKSSNTENEFYFPRKVRMRPGSHHLISYFIEEDVPDGWGNCNVGERRGSLGGAETSIVDYPTGNVYAPENEGLGKLLPRNVQVKLELHHVNTTDKPILREAWINVYWKPEEKIDTWVQDMFMLGSLAVNVPGGEHHVYHNSCEIAGDTRIVDIFGHFHAHTTRFSAWRTRDGKKELFYEVFDYHDTPTMAYDTVTENMTPDRENLIPGGSSGMLDIKKGDLLEWECEVDNTSEATLRYSNELYTGEMCNLLGTYASNSAALLMCRDSGTVTKL
jgi:hypothetical protein